MTDCKAKQTPLPALLDLVPEDIVLGIPGDEPVFPSYTNIPIGRLARDAAAELRRLHAENASLAAALASSCDEQRHELWESGGIAGCERARVAERQRDALLEALKGLVAWADDLRRDDPVEDLRKARAAIKTVEETK